MNKLPDALLYIDGIVRPAEGNKTYDNICPWTGEVSRPGGGRLARRTWTPPLPPRGARLTRATGRNSTRSVTRCSRSCVICCTPTTTSWSTSPASRPAQRSALPPARMSTARSAAWTTCCKCFHDVKWEEDRGRRNEYGFDSDRTVDPRTAGRGRRHHAVERAAVRQRRQGDRGAARRLHRGAKAGTGYTPDGRHHG